jgi:hypothetical protein
MAIVSFEVDLKPDNTTWEERKAQLLALPKAPEDKIVYDDDVPKLTEEQLARFRPFREVMAEKTVKT